MWLFLPEHERLYSKVACVQKKHQHWRVVLFVDGRQVESGLETVWMGQLLLEGKCCVYKVSQPSLTKLDVPVRTRTKKVP